MSHRLVVRPEAESDIVEAALWYEEQRSGLGFEFIAEVRATVDRVAETPTAYRLMRRKPEVRRVLLRRFPYRLFYIAQSSEVIVFAVLHARRRERAWTQRT